MVNEILVKGAKVHNLKNITVKIPREKFIVITGVSGSGKSSLAFDTIYAEGQRRYVESLSSYARQFLGLAEKPDVDSIEGLSPTIAIDQRSISKNPRSTVGTITEIYDYLRLLFAKIGRLHCPICGKEIKKQTIDKIVKNILKFPENSKLILLAPLIRDKKGEHKKLLFELLKEGYSKVRINGDILSCEEAVEINLDKYKKHNIEVVIDRLILNFKNLKDLKSRIHQSLELALELGNGLVIVHLPENRKDILFSLHFNCPKCGINIPPPEPKNFSFNSPYGACEYCSGLGFTLEFSPDLIIPNKNLTINEGAIRPLSRLANRHWILEDIKFISKIYNFSLNVPVKKLSKEILNTILYGTKNHKSNKISEIEFKGVIPILEYKYKTTDSEFLKSELESFMIQKTCPKCKGKRLKPEFLAVTVGGLSIDKVVEMDIKKEYDFFKKLQSNNIKEKLTQKERIIAKPILKEILLRLKFLIDVGVSYLTLSRSAISLSGGEAQRIRLATQTGSYLTGVIYVLDEPSIGLHPKDNAKLISTLKKLRDLGNTVIVVEHDLETILSADYIIDLGPGAGEKGGYVIFADTPSKFKYAKNSLTADYILGRKKIEIPKIRRKGNGKYLILKGAQEHNLKNIDVKFPLGKFICITGVSGSGKSTLCFDILYKALKKILYNSKIEPGKYRKLEGVENIDKVIIIDQSPIGRTPRSNPATYTGLFTYIRDLFSKLPEARIRGYTPGRFSFNVKSGRCEACSGEGFLKVEMQFLPDIYVECEVCHGKRYNQEVLEIHYKGKNIADILEMSVEEALKFFNNIPSIKNKLKLLNDVGLSYIKLGQPAPTLSGGEAQRVKLACELSKKATGKTLYILDEPTVGLHIDDIKKLLNVLNRLCDIGNTILVIEHNLDVIKCSDWIIDLGPEGGDKGGYIIAEGTPEQIMKNEKSITGKYLKKYIYGIRKN